MKYLRQHTNRLTQMMIELERDQLLYAIKKFSGQATAIAEYFDMSRNTLYNRLEFHGINLNKMRRQVRCGVRVVDGKVIPPVGEKKRKYIDR